MKLKIELERENDGRWIADVVELPGVMAYGKTRDEACLNAKRLAFQVLAERSQLLSETNDFSFAIQQ